MALKPGQYVTYADRGSARRVRARVEKVHRDRTITVRAIHYVVGPGNLPAGVNIDRTFRMAIEDVRPLP